jgi:hypothetical protein
MIECLLKLKPCIKKALENFKILEDVLKVLKRVDYLAVKELIKKDSTVLTSEGVFKFQSSDLSQAMPEALRKRYYE